MFEPLRFLHVAEAGLDQALADTGPLSDSVRTLVEEAGLIAFAQMIAGAITAQVDFVLLAGNTFREADKSLRARLALLNGLGLLDEHHVAVFVLPGTDDPEAAWQHVDPLPSNVTLLTADDAQGEDASRPVAILREGRVIATIAAGTLTQLASYPSAMDHQEPIDVEHVGPKPSTNGHARSAPFRVGVLTAWPAEAVDSPLTQNEIAERLSAGRCDYLAVPITGAAAREQGWLFEAGQTLNTRDGIAHHPGRLQALTARETGAHGATLIEVDTQGEIRGTFRPFAAVRRERLTIDVDPQLSRDELIQTLRQECEQSNPQPGERLWLITWVLRGTGEFWESLKTAAEQAALIDALPQTAPGQANLPFQHVLRFLETPPPYGNDDETGELERLFQEHLETEILPDPAFADWLTRWARAEIEELASADWQARLRPLAETLDPEEVLASVRELGREWFRELSDA